MNIFTSFKKIFYSTEEITEQNAHHDIFCVYASSLQVKQVFLCLINYRFKYYFPIIFLTPFIKLMIY